MCVASALHAARVLASRWRDGHAYAFVVAVEGAPSWAKSSYEICGDIVFRRPTLVALGII